MGFEYSVNFRSRESAINCKKNSDYDPATQSYIHEFNIPDVLNENKKYFILKS